MNSELPSYFEKYFEEKFGNFEKNFRELNEKIDDKIGTMQLEIHEIKRDTKWLSQKIWMALGGLGVITLFGTVFVTYFKTLNREQIQEAVQTINDDVKSSLEESKSAKAQSEATFQALNSFFKQYDFKIVNYPKP